MDSVWEGLYLFVAGWLLAQLEIQIEGRHGWAERLPTWRKADSWVLRLTNGKPLTGYHLCFNAFLLTIFHFPLFFVPWSAAVEGRILADYFLFTVVWDFQWFVWNPAWGVRRFLTEYVWWYPRRFLGLPPEYYLGSVGSFLSVLFLWPGGLSRWMGLFFGALAASAAAAAASLFVRWRPKV
jgi:hypothetical protein